jgi:hypothetical protein
MSPLHYSDIFLFFTVQGFSMETTIQPQPDLAQLISHGKSDAEIRGMLAARNNDHASIDQLMLEVKKLRASRNTTFGLTLILIGALMLFMSCVLTIMHVYSSDSFSFVMYGLTTAGILIVFVGLMKIFG